MSCGKIINFLVILQALIVQNKEFQSRHTLLSKLVNSVLFKYDSEYTTPEYYDQFKRNWSGKSGSLYSRNGPRYARFTYRAINNSNEEHEMEAPAAKDSIFHLLEEGEEEEEEEMKENDKVHVTNEDPPEDEEQRLKIEKKKKKIKETLKGEANNDDDDDYELDFLSDDSDNDKEKVDDISATKNKIKPEGKWPHRGIRRRRRFQNLILSLLLLYKLKFFSAIPVVVGILVLLVGTTGMAGFFFALFSAAVGLHNSHFHH